MAGVGQSIRPFSRSAATPRLVRISAMFTDLSTTPSVSTRRATGAARALLTKVDSATAPRLAVYAHGTPRLVWEAVVTGTKDGEPSRTPVYGGARTDHSLKDRKSRRVGKECRS